MSKRWKHQFKSGLPFGIIMPILMTSFDWFGTPLSFKEAFFSKKFLEELVIFLFVGVFIIGYSSWREKAKNEMYNKN
jgi:hypothetical protein